MEYLKVIEQFGEAAERIDRKCIAFGTGGIWMRFHEDAIRADSNGSFG